jgi:transposase
MAAERMSMRKIREVLRLHARGLSGRRIGKSLGVSHVTVRGYLARAERAGLDHDSAASLDDAQLEARLFPAAPAVGVLRPLPDWTHIQQELRKPGVTLQLLWLEHKAAHPLGYQYTQFVTLFRQWQQTRDPVLRQEHKAGEKVFVDYAGQKIPVVDPSTGEIREAVIFVAALGASHYIYAEATWTQSLSDWIASHVRMYAFFGGVPRLSIPDNLKAGVKHACFYEPELNATYLELARHYGTTVLPTRVARPRDKAKVETAVQIVERWILAPLRHHTFFSLHELNEAIARLLEELNRRPFQKMEGNRRQLFESLDRPALLPLPSEPYTFAEWKKARVHIDYHVEVDRHYYSVPHTLLRQPVEVRLTATTVEILHRGKRVAAHVRSHRPGGYTTETAHRPKAHQKHLEWSPDRLIRWGEGVGPSTGRLVQQILERRPHAEQGYRSCLGLLRLGKQHTEPRLEAACFRALRSGATSYRSVKSILEHGLDRVPLEDAVELHLPARHENVRGADYYHTAEGETPCC